MALSLSLGQWSVTPHKATLTWAISDIYGDGIARVRYNIRKAGDLGTWLETGGANGSATLDVTNYTGDVLLDVEVYDFSDRMVSATSRVSVDNFVAPSPPDYVSFEDETATSITFRWGAVSVSPSTVSWRVINIDADGKQIVLADKPLYEREASIAVLTKTLYRVFVLGVDNLGNTSEPSPVLAFRRDPNGPRIVLGTMDVNAARARISWSVLSSTFLKDIRWTLTDGTHTLTGSGDPDGSAQIDVTGFVGTVTFSLTAVDNQNRLSTVTSSTLVQNKPPAVPTLAVDLVGIRFIRVKAAPQPGDVPTDHLVLYGPEGEVRLSAPWIHTFDHLNPATTYSLSVKAVNAAGIASRSTTPVMVDTLADPLAPPPGAPEADALDLVTTLLLLLTDDVMDYLLQLFPDTRLRDPMRAQVVQPPAQLDAVLDFYLPMAAFFGDVIRKERSSTAFYEASEVIDKIPDPLEKLAVFCEKLRYGRVAVAA